MKKRIIGVYNELYYYIDLIVGDEAPETLYKAGNSRFESQTYLSAKDGMGLDEMKKICEATANDFAKKHDATFEGLQYEDYDEESEPSDLEV